MIDVYHFAAAMGSLVTTWLPKNFVCHALSMSSVFLNF